MQEKDEGQHDTQMDEQPSEDMTKRKRNMTDQAQTDHQPGIISKKMKSSIQLEALNISEMEETSRD